MKTVMKIILGILVGGGFLVFIADKSFDYWNKCQKDKAAQETIFLSPNSVKWQLAYQTCSKMSRHSYCPLSIQVDSSEVSNLKNERVKRNFYAILARYRDYDRECGQIRDVEVLKTAIKDLFFKVYDMPGSIVTGSVGQLAFQKIDKYPTAWVATNETYEVAVKRCEEILKRDNPPSIIPANPPQ